MQVHWTPKNYFYFPQSDSKRTINSSEIVILSAHRNPSFSELALGWTNQKCTWPTCPTPYPTGFSQWPLEEKKTCISIASSGLHLQLFNLKKKQAYGRALSPLLSLRRKEKFLVSWAYPRVGSNHLSLVYVKLKYLFGGSELPCSTRTSLWRCEGSSQSIERQNKRGAPTTEFKLTAWFF